ncbi:MAG TPA: hypothetical protein VFM94_03605 [Solirubrobacterales bacterium]|nr:hypothetical protein [Solirubrobacterales bacterium]
MITVLTDILHGILSIPYLVIALLVEAINGWIMIIALLIKGLVALLPGFPALPEVPGGVFGVVNWFFPVSAVLAVFVAVLGVWLIYMGIKIALNWVKVYV